MIVDGVFYILMEQGGAVVSALPLKGGNVDKYPVNVDREDGIKAGQFGVLCALAHLSLDAGSEANKVSESKEAKRRGGCSILLNLHARFARCSSLRSLERLVGGFEGIHTNHNHWPLVKNKERESSRRGRQKDVTQVWK